MNPAALIPTADVIPVPWGWFYALLMVTFLLHILVMNAMLGGGIIALISTFKGGEKNLLVSREFSYKWPYTIAFAVNMGVAPLLFVQVLYGQFIYSSSILMATWWLSIIVLLILAYYGAYIYDFKYNALGGLRIFMLEFSVGLLLIIAFFFSNNMTLMIQPERWQAYFQTANGSLLNLVAPSLLPRYLHFVIGAVAIAGLYLAFIGHFNLIKSKIDRPTLIAKGMTYFTLATEVQILAGIWFLLALPQPIKTQFLGGNTYATLLLISGVLLALVALYHGHRQRLIATGVTALLLLVTMILLRDLVRVFSLQPYFHPSDLTTHNEYSPLIFFLAVFVIGLTLIGYLLKLAFSCRKEVTK